MCFALAGCLGAVAQQFVLHRGKATVVVEGYGPRILRVTISLDEARALAGPGYGIVGKRGDAGWTKTDADHFRSGELSVDVSPDSPGKPPTGTLADISRYFTGYPPYVGITVHRADGATLTRMTGWTMLTPSHKEGTAGILRERRPADDPFFTVGASFAAPGDEHYYGLGQNQQGLLDLRGHSLECVHDYTAAGGPSVCVPFVVTNHGYGLLWDNPSRTRVDFAFNDQTRWTSEVGQRVSFFVIAGATADEIYAGFRQLTGAVPMLPRYAYGYIQSKQRYITQAELLEAARGYRQRHLPLDVMVVDWFHYTKMGEMDMDPAHWPDPAAMNRELHAMGMHSMVSVWPRFEPGTRYYDLLKKNGWFEHLEDGTPTNGLPYDRAGSDIDTTNPDAAHWYWQTIRDNYIPRGFDSFWADETEPDLPPRGSYFHIGPGTEFYNTYPLFHTAAIYDGYRRDLKQRALILSRDAYLGAQRNGAIFWSSDIQPTWDMLRRSIPTGLNFVSSGMPYWCTDAGGYEYLPGTHTPAHRPLLDASDARDVVAGMTIIPSSMCAGLSGKRFSRSSGPTAAACVTKSGAMASRPSRC